jgi:hypothetical protein
MVGGVPELPTPNMLGQLGNIPTMGDQKTKTLAIQVAVLNDFEWGY